jgi:hypothetical protein
LKGAHPLAYADAFAVAAGRLYGAPVLTGDPEILSLPKSIVRVRLLTRGTRSSKVGRPRPRRAGADPTAELPAGPPGIEGANEARRDRPGGR